MSRMLPLAALLFVPALCWAGPAGFVLAVEGEWRIEGAGDPIKVGAEIPQRASLRVVQPTPFSSIRVIDARTGAVALALRCEPIAQCAGPVVLPAAAGEAPDTGPLAALVEKALARLRRNPDRLVATISRSGLSASDGVLEPVDGRVDLRPVFERLPAGSYLARVTRIDCPDGQDCPVRYVTSHEWQPGAPGSGPWVEARRGLYEVAVTQAYVGFEAGAKAWVRVETGPELHQARLALAGARGITQGWGDAMDDAARTTFIRAVLESLTPDDRASALEALHARLASLESAQGPESLAAAEALREIGSWHLRSREPAAAIPYFVRSAEIRRKLLGDSLDVARALSQLSFAYRRALLYEKQVETTREQIAMLDRVKGGSELLRAEAQTQLSIGLRSLDRPAESMEAIRRALAIYERQPGPLSENAISWHINLAAPLFRQGRYEEAEGHLQFVLRHASPETPLGREQRIVAHVLLAETHWEMSLPESALEHMRESVRQSAASGIRFQHAAQEASLAAFTATLLGQVRPAVATARDVMARIRPSEDLTARDYIVTLTNIGHVLYLGGDLVEAARVARMAVEASDLLDGRPTERLATALTLSAMICAKAGDAAESVRLLRRAIGIREALDRAVDRKLVEAMVLLANGEEALGHADEAARLRRGAVSRARETANLQAAAVAFHALGKMHARAGELDAAIFYGKQGLNALQSLRARVGGLTSDERRGFVGTRESSYRDVAAWMVRAGRLSEAQHVLDLLKDEEFVTLLRAGAGAAQSGPLALTDRELAVDAGMDEASRRVVALAAELNELQRGGALSEQQRERKAQLEDRLAAARVSFDRYIAGLNERFSLASVERNRELGAMQLERLVSMRRTLAELGEGTVMLHYVVSPERLSIILTTPTVQVARETTGAEEDLNRAVFEFRRALQHPAEDPRPAARRLYQVAIAPVAPDLAQAGAKTLMLSLDGALRYAPFAALHDGERFLAERYATTIFTAAARDKLKDRPRAAWTMAGLGVTQAHQGFVALPSVKQELEAIRGRVFPGEIYLDDAFTARRLQDSLERGFPLLHIASHFRFRAGAEANSFLLLGDGSHFSLRDIRTRNLDFGAVDLVTLSACETAMGGGHDETGREIEGLGALLQNQGAKGVVATLWPVADASTARFMWTFYSARSGGEAAASKAEALRRAQVEFIKGSRGADARLAHPFFWAPFILMGNWL